MKKCIKCKIEKDVLEFYKNSHPKFKDGIDTYCKECKKELVKKYRSRTKEVSNFERRERRASDSTYREHVNALSKKSYWSNVKGRLLSNTKSRAKRKKIFFNLELHDIKLPERCPILNVKLDKHRYSPTLDRVVPALGYTSANTRVISKKANTMKNDANSYELYCFSKNIMQYVATCEDIVRTHPVQQERKIKSFCLKE